MPPAPPIDQDRVSRLDAATRDLDAPVAVVDLDAFDANAADLVRRAAGLPVRVASKSVRCRALLRRALDQPGYRGVLAYSVGEALWLASDDETGPAVSDDVLVAYPSADRTALRALAADPGVAARVTVMVDGVENLDLLRAAVRDVARDHPLRICLDLDASLRLLPGAAGHRAHLGPRRSPVHDVDQAVALARTVADDAGLRLVGIMAYEGQVAGLPDRLPGNPVRAAAVRGVKRASVAELGRRRAAVVAAVRDVADLELVNGGGTGSLESTARDGSVTEVAAGSGLFQPTLFDGYDSFSGHPAAFFGLDVTRRPGPGLVTVAGGGWIASGPAGRDRLPTPAWPPGLQLLGAEGAGEVQTPLRGDPALTAKLRVGDRVWFRHAKAGELCERVDRLQLVAADDAVGVVRVVGAVPTYRGEGRNFG